MGSFSSSVKRGTKKALGDINSKCYSIAKELFTRVVEFTPSPSNPGPFAHGHLANQWFPSDDGDLSEELDSSTSPTGAASLARIAAMSGAACFGKDGKLALVNNLSYAYRAEALGWPTPTWAGVTGPYRMVAKALQIIKAKYG